MEALIAEFGEEQAAELGHQYSANAFPEGYKADFPPRAAVADLQHLNRLAARRGAATRGLLAQPVRAGRRRPGRAPVQDLPDRPARLPVGRPSRRSRRWASRSSTSARTNCGAATARKAWIYDFGLRLPGSHVHGLGEDARERFQDAFTAVWTGRAENDALNSLVLSAGLTWRQAMVLRAYAKYLRQAGATFSPTYMEDTLRHNVHTTRLLVNLFEARLDPSRFAGGARADRRAAGGAGRRAGPGGQPGRGPHPALLPHRHPGDSAHQLLPEHGRREQDGRDEGPLRRAARVPLDQARPAGDPRSARAAARVRDLGVLTPRRGRAPALRQGRARRAALVGPARGLPYGDPGPGQGAGGQEHRHRPGRRQGRLRRQAAARPGRRPGRLAGRGHRLLQDVHLAVCSTSPTTSSAGDVVHPEDVVRHDGDDTYLVVAADKGTATFSDIANEVAEAYGFWLGDAFASGGSAGYDHKGMGITARGAWESVKRHFRELGHDTQTEDFTVVGVGDMSGDVFGNGMLLSEHIRLVAAFDHRHIFLDPDPDAATSYAERRRSSNCRAPPGRTTTPR